MAYKYRKHDKAYVVLQENMNNINATICVLRDYYYTDVLEGVTLFYNHDVRMVPKRMTKEGAIELGRMVVQVFWEYGFLDGNFIIYKTPITTLLMRSVFKGIASDDRVKFSCLIENYLEAHNGCVPCKQRRM
jgi:hypothetical protein